MKQKLINFIRGFAICFLIPQGISAQSNQQVKTMNTTGNIKTEITNNMGDPKKSTSTKADIKEDSLKDFIVYSKSLGWGPCRRYYFAKRRFVFVSVMHYI